MVNSKQLFQCISFELSSIYPPEEAREMAFLLLFHLGNLSKSDVLSNKLLLLPNTINIEEILHRLKNHEPIQHIIQTVDFCGLKLQVSPHVLIPRVETEELVNLILKEVDCQKALNIVDFGTGSGCIAISLQQNCTNSQVFALDISDNALSVAEHNARTNQANIICKQANILDKSTVEFLPIIDIIVSNPPYILPSEMANMRQNVLDFEPHLALFAPENNPLKFYKAILEIAQTKLVAKGVIYFEINHLMGNATKNLFSQFHYQHFRIIKDMFGKDRFAFAQKP